MATLALSSMFTYAEWRALHEEVFERLLRAGWLERFTFKQGERFHVTWTEAGAEKSRLMKAIVTAHRLCDTDDRAQLFHKLASGDTLPPGTRVTGEPLDESKALLWRQSVQAIDLRQMRIIFSSLPTSCWAGASAGTTVRAFMISLRASSC